MAAERAAELTEAYRILTDEARRQEYDRTLSSSGLAASAAAGAAAPPERPAPASTSPVVPDQPAPADRSQPEGRPRQSTQERATRDEFVRKATLARFRQAFEAVGDGYSEAEPPRPFDFGSLPKPKLFSRNRGPRLLGRYVDRIDADAVVDTLTQAGRWDDASKDEVCVFLMGTSMVPRGDIERAILQYRRAQARGGARVTLIPVDARDWQAHFPVDAPEVAKILLTRLRTGA
jgi:hypothetical protein